MRFTVLSTTKFYLPGYKGGGTIQSLSRLVAATSDRLQYKIVTLNQDDQDSQEYQTVVKDTWVSQGQAQVYYMSPGKRSIFDLLRLVCNTRHDVLLLNSFFSPYFTLLILLFRRLGLIKTQLLLLPRGEFSSEALRLKAFKKNIYLFMVHRLGLLKDIVWQVSTDSEAADLVRVMQPRLGRHLKYTIVRDLIGEVADAAKIIEPVKKYIKTKGELNVVFLSRISRIKNLKFALEILKAVTGKVNLTIYGPVQDPLYWRDCQDIIKTLPSTTTVQSLGEISHSQLSEVFAGQDLFLLPTLGENFGYVIIEALQHGVPAIISDRTPWQNLENSNAGFDISLDQKDQFSRKIQSFVDMDESEWKKWSNGAQSYVKSLPSDSRICDHFVDTIHELGRT